MDKQQWTKTMDELQWTVWTIRTVLALSMLSIAVRSLLLVHFATTHTFFLINATKCEIHDQSLEKAKEILNKAEEVANMYPDSCSDAKIAIQELRLLLS